MQKSQDANRYVKLTDIGLKRIPSYGCFIRLALVRYQFHSEKNFELSAPVRADFIQADPKAVRREIHHIKRRIHSATV